MTGLKIRVINHVFEAAISFKFLKYSFLLDAYLFYISMRIALKLPLGNV